LVAGGALVATGAAVAVGNCGATRVAGRVAVGNAAGVAAGAHPAMVLISMTTSIMADNSLNNRCSFISAPLN
jgi:hypothetical protein